MTVFEKIKSMSIDEFAAWFDDHCSHDTDPCLQWWDNHYCGKCEAEIGRYVDSDREIKFSWCELHDGCRFFPEMSLAPDTLQITKMWLESEYEQDETEQNK